MTTGRQRVQPLRTCLFAGGVAEGARPEHPPRKAEERQGAPLLRDGCAQQREGVGWQGWQRRRTLVAGGNQSRPGFGFSTLPHIVANSAFSPQILRSAKLEEIRLTILNNLLAFHPESGEQLAWGNAARAGERRRWLASWHASASLPALCFLGPAFVQQQALAGGGGDPS